MTFTMILLLAHPPMFYQFLCIYLISDEIEAVQRLYWCRSTAPTVAEKHTGGKTNDGRRETACGPLEIGTYVF